MRDRERVKVREIEIERECVRKTEKELAQLPRIWPLMAEIKLITPQKYPKFIPGIRKFNISSFSEVEVSLVKSVFITV